MSGADRKWIDSLVHTISDSWDNSDKSRPRNLSFLGSEDYIRGQFEEYTLALLSSVNYDNYLLTHSLQPGDPPILPDIDGIPVRDFGLAFVDQWRLTSNYAIWISLTAGELFDIVEPRHPCAGTQTLSLEDVQLRVHQTMQDLKLDERMASSKEAISRTWTSSSSKVRGAVGSAWANLEQYRQQRKNEREELKKEREKEDRERKESVAEEGKKEPAPGTWASWAAEKRKKAFQKEEPARLPRVDIGPAPARPLAQWAKRSNEVSPPATATKSPEIKSLNSSPTSVEEVPSFREEEKQNGNA